MNNSLFNFLKTNPRLAFLYLYSLITPFLGSGVIISLIYTYESEFSVTISLLIFITIATSVLMGLAVVPTTVIALFLGYLLGIWGIIPTIIAYTLASLIGYQVVDYFEKGKAHATFKSLDRTRFIIDNIHEHEKSLIILCRLSPVLPFAIMSIFLSSIKIKLKNFLLYGGLGMFPRSLVFVFVGSQIKEIMNVISQGKEFPIAQISFILLLIISSIGLIAYCKKYVLTKVDSD